MHDYGKLYLEIHHPHRHAGTGRMDEPITRYTGDREVLAERIFQSRHAFSGAMQNAMLARDVATPKRWNGRTGCGAGPERNIILSGRGRVRQGYSDVIESFLTNAQPRRLRRRVRNLDAIFGIINIDSQLSIHKYLRVINRLEILRKHIRVFNC